MEREQSKAQRSTVEIPQYRPVKELQVAVIQQVVISSFGSHGVLSTLWKRFITFPVQIKQPVKAKVAAN